MAETATSPSHRPTRTRLRMPVAVRICAGLCIALFLGYMALYLTLRVTEPSLASAMLRLFGLTIVAGRETALFDAQRNGMPLGMAIGLSIVDDIATLLLNITLVWLLVATLRRVALARRMLARIETQALRHRRWVQRWGLLGLAGFYLLPGFGSGPAVAAGIGVLSRIPAGRLALVLGSGVAFVDALWAVGVSFPANAAPDVAWLDWIPVFVIALLATLMGIGMWRDRGNRGLVLLDWDPRPSPQRAEALAGWGIRVKDGLVEARLAQVAAACGVRRSQALFAVELLLLDGLDPATAATLVGRGITGLHDLVAHPANDLAAAVAVPAEQAALWHEQAGGLIERSGAAWRPEPSDAAAPT